MAGNLCLIVCPFLMKEVSKIIEVFEYDNINVTSFPANCYGKKLKFNDITHILPPHKKFDQVIVFGSYCLDLKCPDNWNFQYQDFCFSALANHEIINSYIEAGNYLITPGWLAGWKTRLSEIGFDHINDTEITQQFFAETTSKLLLLDTGIYQNCSQLLKEFAEYVKLPYETQKIGLDFLRLNLEKIILDWRLKNTIKTSKQEINISLQENANYAMIFDVFSNLTKIISEEIIINKILELSNMLFAPKYLGFMPVRDGKSESIISYSSSSDDLTFAEEQLRKLSSEFVWTDSGKGFILKINHQNKIVGILIVDKIAFPEFKERYLNLAISFAGIFGLSLDNARKYQQTTMQKSQLSKALQDLHKAKKRLEIANSMLRHDIANDLTVIKSCVNIYKRKTDHKVLEEVLKRVQKSIDMIKLHRKQESLIDSTFKLERTELLKILNKLVKNHDEIEINISGTGSVYADNAIYSVFENLINNSINHGKATKVDIEIISHDSLCNIKVKDNGSGIPDEIKDKIFDEGFFHGNTGHTGIGLHIVKHTINEYGGNIFIEDNEPSGAVFIIDLKRYQIEKK